MSSVKYVFWAARSPVLDFSVVLTLYNDCKAAKYNLARARS